MTITDLDQALRIENDQLRSDQQGLTQEMASHTAEIASLQQQLADVKAASHATVEAEAETEVGDWNVHLETQLICTRLFVPSYNKLQKS
jgi:uncharacterized metal-binding protein YceD (DUF177 family)